MRVFTSKKFDKDYEGLPNNIQKTFNEKLKLFVENINHPSLHTKKTMGEQDIWEARVTRNYRFTFTIEKDAYTCLLRRIGAHDILRSP